MSANSPALVGKFLLKGTQFKPVWVTDDIAVSAAPSRNDWQRVVKLNLKSVLEVRAEAEDDRGILDALGISYSSLRLGETDTPTMADLEQASSWVAAEIRGRRRVLIHCEKGQRRSPLLACAALVRLGFTVQAAYDVVRKAQPAITLTLGQAGALEKFAGSLSRSE